MMMLGNRGHGGIRGGGGDFPGGGVPAAAHRGSKTVNVMGFRVPKKAAIGALALSGLLAIVGPDLDLDLLSPRRGLKLATTCIHNIYVDNFDDATLMPAVPERDEKYVPVHMKLCYEWLRRDALHVDDLVLKRINVLEHEDVCLDWTAPHYAIMEIVSNLVLQKLLKRVRYRHGCPEHREYEESKRGYDWSTIQTILQEPAMAVDADVVDEELFLEQCKYCAEAYEGNLDAGRVRSRSFHHCFAFPETSNLYKDPFPVTSVETATLLPLPSKPDPAKSSAPISAVLRPLRSRLVHSAVEWVNVTDAPPQEAKSGTVIMIDPGTLGIPPGHYDQFIDPDTTSIAILAGPQCWAANLPTGDSCAEYGAALRDHFRTQFPQLGTTGFEGGPGVDFQISASTAGTFSRAVLANHLLCAIRTASCLLPPVGKPPNTKSTVLAVPCPDCPGPDNPAVKFFENVGTNDNTDVWLLPDHVVPHIYEGQPDEPPKPSIPQAYPTVPLAPAFPAVQEPTQGDGFPKAAGPLPPGPDLQALPLQSSEQAYKNAEPKVAPSLSSVSTGDPTESSPLENAAGIKVAHSDTEDVPTPEEIQKAIDEGTPLDTNTPNDPPQEPEVPVDPTLQTELATDGDAGLEAPAMDDQTYIELSQQRKESRKRTVSGYDGNYLYEVPCPSADDVGNAIVTDDGYSITDNGDTVVVSDGEGTVTFESPVVISTVEVKEADFTDPVTGNTTHEKYVEVDDPTRPGEKVNVTQSNKVGCDCDREAKKVTNEIGQLVTEPNTQQGCLLTMGEARLLKKKNPTGPETHTVIEGKVLSAGNENVPPSDAGTVVMNPDGGFEVTQRAADFSGFQHVDPLDGNTGQYQHFISSPLQTNILRVPFDQCKRHDFPTPLVIVGQFGMMVAYQVAQTFKAAPLSWMAVRHKDLMYGGDEHCIKRDDVPYGPVRYSRRMAMCEFNPDTFQMEAVIDVYIHDPVDYIGQQDNLPPEQFDITPYIPSDCEPTPDYGNKCKFKYRVSCNYIPGGMRRRLGEAAAADDVRAPLREDAANANDGDGDEGRLLFARNILEQCPELGRERTFDRFVFGGNAQHTRKIPVHVKGQKPVYPGRIARSVMGDGDAASAL